MRAVKLNSFNLNDMKEDSHINHLFNMLNYTAKNLFIYRTFEKCIECTFCQMHTYLSILTATIV